MLVVQVKDAVPGAGATGDAPAWGRAADAPAPEIGATAAREMIEKLLRRPEYAGVKLIVAVSSDIPLDGRRAAAVGHLHPLRLRARRAARGEPSRAAPGSRCAGPLGIDATWKPGYPEPVAHTPELLAKVDAWWGQGAG